MEKKIVKFVTSAMLLAMTVSMNAQSTQAFQKPFGEGTLTVTPVARNAVRIQYSENELDYTLPEYVYVGEQTATGNFAVDVNTEQQTVTVKNAAGTPVFIATKHQLKSGRAGDYDVYEATLSFTTPDVESEYQYGLGQFQDDQMNIRGLSRRLTQVNTQMSVPMLISNKGYGVLWNNYGMTEFNPGDQKRTLSKSGNRFTGFINIAEAGRYSFLLDVGQSMTQRHNLVIDGQTVIDISNTWLPPTTSIIVDLAEGSHSVSAELTDNDNAVLYYKKVDEQTTFHSPIAKAVDYTVFLGTPDEIIAANRELTGEAPLMPKWALGYVHCRERFHTQEELLSVATRLRKEQYPTDLIVQDWQYWGGTGWNSMQFDPAIYPNPKEMTDSLHRMNMRMMLSVWSNVDKSSAVGSALDRAGYVIPGTVWVDFFNPAAADAYWRNFKNRLLPTGIDAWWQDAVEPENDGIHGTMVANGKYPGDMFRNIYPLMVSKTVGEGLLTDQPEKRPLILTRCAFTGIQRYGSVMWSGDVGSDWKAFRRQIVAGLGMQSVGLPWWTYDAGGFFRPGNQYTDKGAINCMLRWIETAVYLPMMRIHGYQTNTEPWEYGEEAQEIIRHCMQERYRLLPYIYSNAAAVSFDHTVLMRPLVFDFTGDQKALEQKYEYMFGKSMLISPVIEPDVTTWTTYLPENAAGWYDFGTDRRYEGGQDVNTSVDNARIPVFVRGGSILPYGPVLQYSEQQTDEPMELRIYPGADAEFTLYEDDGYSNDYKNGACSRIQMTWDDANQELVIGARQGSYAQMPAERQFKVVLIGGASQTVQYNGEKLTVKIGQAEADNTLKQYFNTQITDGDMKTWETKDVEFIKSLNADRFLYYFRQRVGLSNPSGIAPYGGWEQSDLKGHTLGHYLTALSLIYAQSGDAEALATVQHIVEVLRQVQNKVGTGYLSAFNESMLDQVESDGSGWAPYYTLHKILQGLVDAYVYTGNATALTAASDFATYIYGRTTKLKADEAKWLRNLDIQEVGGFAEAILNVYKYTQDERHLEAGQFFQQMSKLQPSAEGRDILHDTRTENFHHANATIPQFIAAEREYEVTGNEKMLLAAVNFWDNVVEHRSYCNGSTSYHEHWNLQQDRLSQELNGLAGETCCTNNLIKLSNDLFRFLRDAKYAEYVERATLNHIMGSMNPDNANFMYFHTQLPGSYKTYGKNTEVFWCCTGTGLENHVRYGQSVFFGNASELYVCQFFPASLDWKETGLKLTQETLFPNEEHTKLRITEGTASATIKIRIPTWCDNFSVTVNGSTVATTEENGFCCIDHTWSVGDCIDIDIPMHLRVEPLKDKPRMAAIFYGPLVLAGDLGTDGVTYDRVNTTDNYYNGYPADFKPAQPVPVLTGSMEDMSWMDKATGSMAFTTTATTDETSLSFLPLYKAINMRFADYWMFQGDLAVDPLTYPDAKTGAKPVIELEDGVEYAFQNANETLPNRRFFWDWENLRTRSSGNIDDLKVVAEKNVVDGDIYWAFRITSSDYKGRYVGRTNDRNVQISNKVLWKATYVESTTDEGNGFVLRIKGDTEDGLSAMMMNGDGTWAVVWQYGDPGNDYTPMTTHWQFFKTSEMNPTAMEDYNKANLLLYQYLTEASQMYDRGIRAVIPAYNSAMKVYVNPDNSLEDINAAISMIREAINESVSGYEQDVEATYGIINPGFENLSAQHDEIMNQGVAVPFGWTLTKNGNEVTPENAGWYWGAINADGGAYMEGGHVFGVWNGSNYGNIELSQTLTGLPNGRWQLTARLLNNHVETGNLARLFANDHAILAGSRSDYTSLPQGENCTFFGSWATADNDMSQLMSVETEVTDGTLKIGARANGFFKVDDFRLTCLEQPTAIGEIVNSKSSNGKCFDLSGRRVNRHRTHGIYIFKDADGAVSKRVIAD